MKYVAFAVIFMILLMPLSHGSPEQGEIKYNWNFYGRNFELVLNVNGSESTSISHVFNFWLINISIPYSDYQFYRDYPAGYRIGDDLNYLSYFATPNDTYLQALAHLLDDIAKNNGWDILTEANFILTFVQNIPYVSDLSSTGFVDYYKFPLETLFQQGGDCEDKSLLLATILYILGYDVVLFAMEIQFRGTYGHVAVGLNIHNKTGPFSRYLQYSYSYQNREYYYMESTGSDSLITSGGSIKNVHYWVGISPEAAGASISNLTVIPLDAPHYDGYKEKYDYAREVKPNGNFTLYLVYVGIIAGIFVPLFLYSLIKERKRCPACGYPVEEDYNYCPNCGYWIKPPPKT